MNVQEIIHQPMIKASELGIAYREAQGATAQLLALYLEAIGVPKPKMGE